MEIKCHKQNILNNKNKSFFLIMKHDILIIEIIMFIFQNIKYSNVRAEAMRHFF